MTRRVRVPAPAPVPASTTVPEFTSTELRAMLGRIPTGVMIVTTRTASGGHQARTANSFASVSLTPPLVSVCFGATSPFTASLQASGTWAVSVLSAEQAHLSRRFASSAAADDLTDVPHVPGTHTSAALLTDSLATLECSSVLVHPVGDHILFVGEVLGFHLHRDAAPLVFCRGDYHSGPLPASLPFS